MKDNETKHKVWFIMDSSLILPEYLVEFEYILKDNNQNKIADFGDHIGNFK